jgi:hypothetical protein
MKTEISGSPTSIYLPRTLRIAVAIKLEEGNLSELVQKLLQKWIDDEVEV